MADPPSISRIVSIKNLGAFQKHPPTGGNVDLKQINLVYGFNGTGKTTLSRIFSSLEAGVLRSELPIDGTFEIELSNGTTIKNDSNLNILKETVLVFNTDFIESNFRWKDGKANPIFYLGSEQSKVSQRLESVEADLTSLRPRLDAATRNLAVSERTFGGHKRDTARHIGEQINQARNYDATSIANDYTRLNPTKNSLLDDEKRHELRRIINADAPPSQFPTIDRIPNRLSFITEETQELLSQTLGDITIADLRKHDSMLVWLSEGLEYHQKHELSLCLLCGNPLKEPRLKELRSVLNDSFVNLMERIKNCIDSATTFRNQLNEIISRIPDAKLITERSKDFADRTDRLKMWAETGCDHIDRLLLLLEKKKKQPNLSIGETHPTEIGATAWDQKFSQALDQLNAAIETHNLAQQSFKETQDKAKLDLKMHFLAEGLDRYREIEKTAIDAAITHSALGAQVENLTQQSSELRQNLREHGPAATKINNLISSYLGHGSLKIEAIKEGEDGYVISRHGKPITGPLSEGEKTAISVCYFLSTIEAERRKLKDLIVVVDDPISSLDTRALHYAFSLITGALAEAKQLFILTHNLFFMNEVKKWLKNRYEKGKAQLLFLDTLVDLASDRRTTEIVEMPKLIRDYESEYHYLFYLTLGFKNDSRSYDGYFYLMPNALRKMLDVFFAFKVPGSGGLSSKLDSNVVRDCGVDREKLRALDRLAQLESHSDSLDDLIALSSISIEETRDAASALFTLIEAADPPHFQQMCKLCS